MAGQYTFDITNGNLLLHRQAKVPVFGSPGCFEKLTSAVQLPYTDTTHFDAYVLKLIL